MKTFTTLNKIKQEGPSKGNWNKLLKSLNKTEADNEPLTIAYIFESNGFEFAMWCLRCVDFIEKSTRLYATFCARQIVHINPQPALTEAINVSEQYALGAVTENQLKHANAAVSLYVLRIDPNASDTVMNSIYISNAVVSVVYYVSNSNNTEIAVNVATAVIVITHLLNNYSNAFTTASYKDIYDKMHDQFINMFC